jgi:hypothetical protein
MTNNLTEFKPKLSKTRTKAIADLLESSYPHLTKKQQIALKKICESDVLPKNETEWAKFCGVSRWTWYQWMNNSYWQQVYLTVPRSHALCYLPGAVQATGKAAQTSKEDRSKLYEMTGFVEEKKQTNIQINSVHVELLEKYGDKIKQLAESMDGVMDLNQVGGQ